MLKKLIILSLLASSAFAADYKIDPAHSSVGFKIKHLAISKVPGRFADFSGTFSYDPNDISKAKTEAVIKVASINTDQTKRDDHLRSPDFFEAEKFPEIKFVSSSVKGDAKSFEIEGDLTLHGVTKKTTLSVVHEGAAKDPYGKERDAFTATAKINRKDFGLAWNKLLETGALVVGEEVEITLEIVGTKEA